MYLSKQRLYKRLINNFVIVNLESRIVRFSWHLSWTFTKFFILKWKKDSLKACYLIKMRPFEIEFLSLSSYQRIFVSSSMDSCNNYSQSTKVFRNFQACYSTVIPVWEQSGKFSLSDSRVMLPDNHSRSSVHSL